MATTKAVKGNVLVVESEPAALAFYSSSLAKAGYDVAQAAGGAEALQRLEKNQFDVVLSDISTPKSDGLGLLRRMRTLAPEQNIVVLVDELDNQTAIHAAELGALQSLEKPLKLEILLRTVGHAVRLNRVRQNPVPTLRKHHLELNGSTEITATRAKNEFGQILERVLQGGTVFITKHQDAKAVLISVDEFNALSRARETKLDTLSREFDALLAQMQTAKSRTGLKAAFGASPKRMGKAALELARKRG